MTTPDMNLSSLSDNELEKALAALISCTRSRTRPLPLTEIAKWLDIAIVRLGSIKVVADRIGLSAKMLGQFMHVKRLSPRVQKLFENRQLDSVDSTTHLAMLSEDEQVIAAEALASGSINTIDLRAVVELKKRDPSTPISSLMRKVSAGKVKKEYIIEFVIRGGQSKQGISKKLNAAIPSEEVVALEIEDIVGRLVLTAKGKQTLVQVAKKLGIPIKHVIPAILN